MQVSTYHISGWMTQHASPHESLQSNSLHGNCSLDLDQSSPGSHEPMTTIKQSSVSWGPLVLSLPDYHTTNQHPWVGRAYQSWADNLNIRRRNVF